MDVVLKESKLMYMHTYIYSIHQRKYISVNILYILLYYLYAHKYIKIYYTIYTHIYTYAHVYTLKNGNFYVNNCY